MPTKKTQKNISKKSTTETEKPKSKSQPKKK